MTGIDRYTHDEGVSRKNFGGHTVDRGAPAYIPRFKYAHPPCLLCVDRYLDVVGAWSGIDYAGTQMAEIGIYGARWRTQILLADWQHERAQVCCGIAQAFMHGCFAQELHSARRNEGRARQRIGD